MAISISEAAYHRSWNRRVKRTVSQRRIGKRFIRRASGIPALDRGISHRVGESLLGFRFGLVVLEGFVVEDRVVLAGSLCGRGDLVTDGLECGARHFLVRSV